MPLINELAQWAALVFLGILVFGLTRQLGQFIIPRRDQLLYQGPEVGDELPKSVINGVSAHQLGVAINEGPGLALVAVVNDKCLGCQGLIERLETLGTPANAPLIAVVDSNDADFTTRIDRVFDFVVRDDGLRQAREIGISATPYILGIDADLRIAFRGISGDLHGLVAEWLPNHRPVATIEASPAEAGRGSRDEVEAIEGSRT
jgi:hypothetical protein